MTTIQVAREYGVSLRQLQWWDERQVITPNRGKGVRREYDDLDCKVILVVAEMRKAGVSLQNVRAFLRQLRTLLDSGHTGYVVVMGKRCWPAESAKGVLDVMSHAQRKYQKPVRVFALPR